MKQTKEQLVKENIKLNSENLAWDKLDVGRRKEFAKAFNWWKLQTIYDYGDREPLLPSWEEIFVEVGKLLAARTFYDFEGNISELECAVKDLQEKLNKNLTEN